jgi:hypothetical protein
VLCADFNSSKPLNIPVNAVNIPFTLVDTLQYGGTLLFKTGRLLSLFLYNGI